MTNEDKTLTLKVDEYYKTSNNYYCLPLDMFVVKDNIRKINANDKDIEELAESMKTHGQLEDILCYEEGGKYVVIFGHRRYYAALKGGIDRLKFKLIKKPETDADLIYLQINENDQSIPMTPAQREEVVHRLEALGESLESIAKKMGKKVAWIRECSISYKLRSKYGKILEIKGIKFSTDDFYQLRNASEEQILKLAATLKEYPNSKKSLLDEINNTTKKKKNSGKKVKNRIIRFELFLNENENTVLIKIFNATNINKDFIDNIENYIYEKFRENNYKIIKKE